MSRGLRIALTVTAVALFAAAVAVALGHSDDGGSTVAGAPATTSPASTVTPTLPPNSTTSSTAAVAPTTMSTSLPVTAPPTARPTSGIVRSAKGILLPVKGSSPSGVEVETPCGKTATLTDATPVTATVVLDPGHGGDETGALGPTGLQEKAVNLAVAKAAMARLVADGIPTVLTRDADYRMTLGARADIAKAAKAEVFVSVHHNAVPETALPGPGTSSWYQIGNADSKRLAGLIFEQVHASFAAHAGIAWVGDTDAGAKYRVNSAGGDYYGILRLSHGVVGALSEGAYMTNPPEEALLAQPAVQQAEGKAIATAVERYLNTKDPGSGFVEPHPRDSPAGGGGGSSGCVDPAL